jgi:hypothetical protein
MRSLQGTFPRHKKRLPCNAWKCKKVIQPIILIYDYRAEHVEVNQIKAFFNPEYKQYINLMGYDRIKHFHFDEVDNTD